jgi:leucine-rich repeat protein SHOC2
MKRRLLMPFVVGLLSFYTAYSQSEKYAKVDFERTEVLKVIDQADLSTQRLKLVLPANAPLPEKVYTLTNLAELKIDQAYNTAPPAIGRLSPEINKLTKLQRLTINNAGLTAFPEHFNELKQLKQFTFSSEEISIKRFPDLSRLDSLQVVEIRLNENSNFGEIENADKIFNIPTIEKLRLVLCQLDDKTIGGIAKLTNLKDLELSTNNISDLSVLSHNRQLQKLYMPGNMVTDFSPLVQNTQLKQVVLFKNNITSLPTSLEGLEQLEELDLRFNQLTELTAAIKHLKSLKKLSLDDNNIKSIPAEIGQLKSLELLTIRGNGITELPDELFELPNLRILDVVGNNLKTLSPKMYTSNIQEISITQYGDGGFEFKAESFAKMRNLRKVAIHTPGGNLKMQNELSKEKRKFEKMKPYVTVF